MAMDAGSGARLAAIVYSLVHETIDCRPADPHERIADGRRPPARRVVQAGGMALLRRRSRRDQKYSGLTDVNPENVQRLEIAWQWKHWDAPIEQYKTFPGQF